MNILPNTRSTPGLSLISAIRLLSTVRDLSSLRIERSGAYGLSDCRAFCVQSSITEKLKNKMILSANDPVIRIRFFFADIA